MNWHVCLRPARWAVPLATAIAAATFAATCLAPSPPARADEGVKRKIMEALDESTTLEFIETPLRDVLSYLEDVHEIEIQIDERALDAAGLARDTPVTRNVRGISLGAALRLMLTGLGMTYEVRDEVLLVTTPQAAQADPVIRVYQVEQLLDLGQGADELATVLTIACLSADRSAPGTRIIPHRQTLIVRATTLDHRNLAGVLKSLRRVNGGRAIAGLNREDGVADVTFGTARNKKIEAALNQPTRLELIETPFQDMVDYLKDYHDIEIQVDVRLMQDQGIGSQPCVTISIKGVSLRSALRLVLGQFDMTYCIRDGVLLITKEAYLAADPETKVYNVSGLLDFGQPADELAFTLKGALAREISLEPVADSLNDDKKGSVRLPRIAAYRQALIVRGTQVDFEACEDLLRQLCRAERGTAKPASGTAAGRKRRALKRKPAEEDPFAPESTIKPGDVKASPANGEDPFAQSAPDPFGAGSDDPFGGGGDGPFGGGTKSDEPNPEEQPEDPDPFGGGGDDPFGGGTKSDEPKSEEPPKDPDPFGGTGGQSP